MALCGRPLLRHRQPGLHSTCCRCRTSARAIRATARKWSPPAAASSTPATTSRSPRGQPRRAGRPAGRPHRQLPRRRLRRRLLPAPTGAAASAAPATLALLGLDISKWAVQSAAKQDKRPNWIVGSNANLPVLPGTLDRVLCMFGFPGLSEFARVLQTGRRAAAGRRRPDHLRELREIIYPTLKPERTSPAEPTRQPPKASRPRPATRPLPAGPRRPAEHHRRPAGDDAAPLPRHRRRPRPAAALTAARYTIASFPKREPIPDAV
jgi:hypothetical protein